jgi:hypothetical protein
MKPGKRRGEPAQGLEIANISTGGKRDGKTA